MSRGGYGDGRGGRGGIPINYPDGVACKPMPKHYPEMCEPLGLRGRGILPVPKALSARNKEMLAFFRGLREFPGSNLWHIDQAPQSPHHLKRYSERYPRSKAPAPFPRSDSFYLRSGVDYPKELEPAAPRGRKRRRLTRTPKSLLGVTWGEDEGAVIEYIREEGDNAGENEDDDAGGEGARGMKGVDVEERGASADDSEIDEDDDPEQELFDDVEQYWEDGGGYEDGNDDVDSGGEEEPTY